MFLLTSISGDPKNACLKQLDNAPKNLNLFKTDMLDYDTVRAGFAGCEGVFHLASPVPIDKMVDKEVSTYSHELIQLFIKRVSSHPSQLSHLSGMALR